ncbi:DUF3846 domain-containing protein [Gordonia amicalis]|uniref:DUF3846 domain-containing protein n=1 Tax=Gordonia amicalis TaxID=89053 RepID=A0ABU4DJU0_9ACTN|nr:DUF3846 domain-containing protein [Gordonia amicalis]MDV6310019.1 DUF3846 domain-containing protein [Gordonia amicalis]
MATAAVVSGVRIDTEGAVSRVTANGGDTLSMLQAGVGGYVDVVRLPAGIDMWVGDEAAYTQPVNAWASVLNDLLDGQPVIWGPVVFASSTADGETVSLSGEQVARLAAWFAHEVEAPDVAAAIADLGGVETPAGVQ